MAQSLNAGLLISALVTISQLVSLSLASGSVLTAQDLLGILSLSVLPLLVHAHTLSISLKINKLYKKEMSPIIQLLIKI